MRLAPTASQTVGPYLHIGLAWLTIDTVAPPTARGEHVIVEGRVLDGDGQPVNDALIEIWQASADGKYAHPDDNQDKPLQPGFRGFGRVPTDQQGRFRFSTIKPGPVPGPDNGNQAPHLLVSVFMRGLLKRLVSRIYFPGDPRNEDDPVLRLAPADRRHTLIAKPTSEAVLEWNVVLQGEGETVFFDC
jgi:protocatechuate 3,4-dioxygenase alpha subunit